MLSVSKRTDFIPFPNAQDKSFISSPPPPLYSSKPRLCSSWIVWFSLKPLLTIPSHLFSNRTLVFVLGPTCSLATPSQLSPASDSSLPVIPSFQSPRPCLPAPPLQSPGPCLKSRPINHHAPASQPHPSNHHASVSSPAPQSPRPAVPQAHVRACPDGWTVTYPCSYP